MSSSRGAANWLRGYSQAELDAAQERFGLRFPPDLVELLRQRRPVHGYDWRTDDEAIRDLLAWPLEGLLFDVENGHLWWPEWGERPTAAADRAEIVTRIVASAPKLIPLQGHRYIPAEPHQPGNPVFSVYQSDVIYYGANLDDYFEREFGDPQTPLSGPIRRIRFWSELADRSGL